MEYSDPHTRHPAARRLVAAAAAAFVAVLLLSPTFGRADPVGSYRPDLPPDALTNGCWPLPGGVRLDFGYQVRSDELRATADGSRRQLVLHYDELSGSEATQRVEADFAGAGVADAYVMAHDFSDLAPDAVVRGQMLLDLPPSKPERGSECRAPFSTKNFPLPLDDRS